jgi:thioredoxin reductase
VVRLEDGQELEAASIVLATGASVALAEAAGIVTADGTEPRIKRIVVVDGEGRTSRPGVWAAGTAAGVSVHTIITAGDGARVAINLLSERKGERHVDHDVLPDDGSRPV